MVQCVVLDSVDKYGYFWKLVIFFQPIAVEYGKLFSHLIRNCRYLYLNTDIYNCVLNVKTACNSRITWSDK